MTGPNASPAPCQSVSTAPAWPPPASPPSTSRPHTTSPRACTRPSSQPPNPRTDQRSHQHHRGAPPPRPGASAASIPAFNDPQAAPHPDDLDPFELDHLDFWPGRGRNRAPRLEQARLHQHRPRYGRRPTYRRAAPELDGQDAVGEARGNGWRRARRSSSAAPVSAAPTGRNPVGTETLHRRCRPAPEGGRSVTPGAPQRPGSLQPLVSLRTMREP